LALKGTASPPISEVRNQGPPQILSTESRYGYVFVGVSKTASFGFKGLTSGTEYVLFVYTEDRGANFNGDAAVLNFQTAGTPLVI
jgi:hypothetical protein